MADIDLDRARRILADYEREAAALEAIVDFLNDQRDQQQGALYRIENTIREYQNVIAQHEVKV